MKNTQRLLSLDAFRGLTIAGMILVNTPGSWSYLYAPLAHADWHGCTPTDLVFPFFLFIVGVSMWFSFKKYQHQLNQELGLKILKRALILFVIGLLLRAFPFTSLDWANFRILGVLQRIALAFGLAAFICLLLRDTKKLLLFSTVLLLLYWWLLYAFGGAEPYSLETNAVRQLDIWLLGESHLWQGKGIPFDPEGLLSTLPAVVSVILGYLTGEMIGLMKRENLLQRMMVLGAVAMIIGWIWSFAFPINKSIWTSSYVLWTTGIALLLLALFIWVIDLKAYKKWASPLLVFGTNSLFAYVLSMVWVKLLFKIECTNPAGETVDAYQGLYENIMVPIAGNLNGSLLFALAHIIFFWAILWVLYRKRIFIKI